MEKEYNKYLWSPKQPRVYGISPLTISGTPMPEEDVATLLKVENSQQRFQQNPIVKRSEQWEAQQKQREEEIAASKKWLELHPEDESDSPYTILERGKHQAIVDGKDPSYYEKMIDDGKQFTKGALSVLSLPYLSAAAAGAYGYGASLGARGLFAGQGIYGLANKDGVRKTANLIKSGNYGRAALSGAGDALNAAMVLPGAKFLGSVAKYGLKPAIAGDMLNQSVRLNVPNFNKPLVKYYGPTMGKTTAKSEKLIDFDDIMRPIKESLAKDLGITREELVKSGHPALQQAYADQINLWRNNPANNGKILMVSSAGTLDPKYKITFDNYPMLPERSNFIRRNIKRGATEEDSAAWYDDLVQRFPFHIDNRFVSEIESTPKSGGLLRIGDVEINDALSNYRQVGRGTANDFIRTGNQFAKIYKSDNSAVTRLLSKTFSRPMYKQGSLWYGLDSAKGSLPDLLVTREPMHYATQHARVANVDLGGRRVPATILSSENTVAYTYHPGYGYRKVTIPERTSYALLERPSKLTDLELKGFTKNDRFYNDPEVFEKAKIFAKKYGYEEPTTLDEIKNMYRQHNTAFRSVSTDLPEEFLGKTVANLPVEERAKFLASKGYPEVMRSFQNSGIGKYSDDYVFVSPSIAENNVYKGDGMMQVQLQRPFTWGNPKKWHINADWRPHVQTPEAYPSSQGAVINGNTSPMYEFQFGTKNLIPVRVTTGSEKGTNLGVYLDDAYDNLLKSRDYVSVDFPDLSKFDYTTIHKQGGILKRK